MKKKYYSNDMLPGVNYKDLEADGTFGDQIIDLEYEAQKILCEITEETKDLMSTAGMVTVVEMMIAHLGAYLVPERKV